MLRHFARFHHPRTVGARRPSQEGFPRRRRCCAEEGVRLGGAYPILFFLAAGLLMSGCGSSGGGGVVEPPSLPAPVRLLFVSDRDGRPQLYTMAPDGTGSLRWAASPGRDVAPAWSPDRTRVAFVSDRSGVSHVYGAAANGSDLRDLTPGPAVCGAPTWSPDGDWLAFVQWEQERSGAGGGAEANIRVMRANGSESRALTADAGINGGPVWTATGQIYFTTNRERGGTGFDLYVMDATGAGQRKVAAIPGLLGRPAVSPAGSRIVYAALIAPETPGLFVMEAGGGAGRRIGPDNSAEPDWSPDGRQILFTSWKDGNAEVYSMDAGGGNVRRLTSSPAADGGASW